MGKGTYEDTDTNSEPIELKNMSDSRVANMITSIGFFTAGKDKPDIATGRILNKVPADDSLNSQLSFEVNNNSTNLLEMMVISHTGVTIAGDLNVNNIITSTNTTIHDTLIELGNGITGTPSNDSGIIIERGTSANLFMGWDEDATTFRFATTTATGASTGYLTLTDAALACGAITSSGIIKTDDDTEATTFRRYCHILIL